MASDPEPCGRTVRVDGRLVRLMRMDRAWTVETLASKARMSVKTIKNIESSKPIYLDTLDRLAKALGVNDPASLLNERRDYVKDSVTPTKDVLPTKVEVIFQGNITDIDETDDFQRLFTALKQKGEIRGKIIVLAVTEGSIVVALELSDQDSLSLIRNFVAGNLNGLSVDSIRLPIPQNPTMPPPSRTSLGPSIIGMALGLLMLPIIAAFKAVSMLYGTSLTEGKDRYQRFLERVDTAAKSGQNARIEITNNYVNISLINSL